MPPLPPLAICYCFSQYCIGVLGFELLLLPKFHAVDIPQPFAEVTRNLTFAVFFCAQVLNVGIIFPIFQVFDRPGLQKVTKMIDTFPLWLKVLSTDNGQIAIEHGQCL